ncbi:MAG: hypothetical protein Q8R24_09990, partial [Legionellaceae bacterium]|nr:hypothetical protein [Legionellaceae bacterium]
CYWVESIYFMKTVSYCVINKLVEGNRSQVSWTERHEALFMSFCPKSNNLKKEVTPQVVDKFSVFTEHEASTSS